MKNIKCPSCQSLNAKRIRKMWKKREGNVIEGMQYRCQDCKRYFVFYQ